MRRHTKESSYLALRVAQRPAVMEEGVQHQRVRVEGYHQIGKRQTHHKHIT